MTKNLPQDGIDLDLKNDCMYLQKSLAGMFVISVGHPARVGVTAGIKRKIRETFILKGPVINISQY